jgi:glycosyltransferase involved in cell wall biosynthesis
VCVTVDPVLGRAAASTPTGLETLLDRRASECFELRRENSMLRASLEDPWLRGAKPVREPTDALEVSIVIALAEEHGDESIPAILEALRAQSYPTERFEVLVSNAAGLISADTAAALAAPRGLRVRALDVSVPGRAAANNRAIAEASGDLVILLGDDFIPGPDLVGQHVALHAEDPRPETVGIGPGYMSEEQRRDPFARWIEDSGELFGLSFTARAGEIPEYFFYGANTSCKRSFMLAAGPLNESFDGVAWDDYEYGRRLVARGMRARFVAGAFAHHDHALGLAERRNQMRRAGAAAVVYDGIYPPGHPWHSGVSDETMPGLLRTGWIRSLAVMRRRDSDRGAYFRLTLRRAFLKGYRAAASARRDGHL